MKAALLLMVAVLVAAPVLAAPVCYPGEGGCSEARVAYFDGGFGFCWWQPGANDWESVCASAEKYADLAPDERGSLLELWIGPKDARGAVWERQVTRALTPAESAVLAQLLAERPPSLYVVKPYFLGTRPTYPIVNGSRSTRSNGRIATGSDCDCSARFGDYCLVREATVALCARRQQ